jgi:hypothetical protein
VLEHYEGTDQAFGREVMAALGQLLQAPAMRGEYLKVNFEMQNALAAAIAERTGTDLQAENPNLPDDPEGNEFRAERGVPGG